MYKLQTLNKRQRIAMTLALVAIVGGMILMMINPTFAATNYVTTIKNVMNNMINIVGTIFQTVGVILSVYATGQLIMAFKNEDANSKSTASTLLVVGIVLIALPGIVSTLNLVSMIGS